MSNFKIRLKLELDVEGTREDIPLISQAVSNQIGGLLSPATDIVTGDMTSEISGETNSHGEIVVQATNVSKSTDRKRSRNKKNRPQLASDQNGAKTISWRHDPEKYGNPRQEWSTANKSIWLIYVVSQETDIKELAASQIQDAFNKYFKQAKMINQSNISRDLGKLKMTPNTPVAEDARVSPSLWYLTQAGEKRALELVAEALGQTNGKN